MAKVLTPCTADTLVVSRQAKLCSVSIAPLTATPTAGLLTIYDATSETGTVLYKEWVFATTPGHTIELECICRNGIYVGFDATLANVGVYVSWE